MSYVVMLSKPQDVLVKELFNYFNAESYDISHLSLVGAPAAQEGPYNTYQRIAITPHPEGVDVGTAIIHFNRIDLSTLFSVVEVKLREVDIRADGSFDEALVLQEVQRKYGIDTSTSQFGVKQLEGQDVFYAKSANPAFIGYSPLVVEASLDTRVSYRELNGFMLHTEIVFDDVWIVVDTEVPVAMRTIGHSAVVIGDYVYMQKHQIAWKMSLIDYTWTQLPSLPFPLEYATSVAYAGNWYVYGGRAASTWRDFVYSFNVTTEKWLLEASIGIKLIDFPAVVVGDEMYVYGGWPGGARSRRLFAYNFKTRTTRIIGDYGVVSQGATMVYIDGKLYIYGGTTGSAAHASFVIYDVINERLVSESLGPYPLAAHSALAIGSKMYIFGGNSAGGAVRSYDTATEQWEELAPMPAPTYYGPVVHDHVNGGVLLITGANNANILRYK